MWSAYCKCIQCLHNCPTTRGHKKQKKTEISNWSRKLKFPCSSCSVNTNIPRINQQTFYLEFIHSLLQAVLGLGLLPHQDNVPRGIMDGDIWQVEAPAHQLLQFINTWRAQEHQGAGLGHVDHLTLQLHDLAGRAIKRERKGELRKLGL